MLEGSYSTAGGSIEGPEDLSFSLDSCLLSRDLLFTWGLQTPVQGLPVDVTSRRENYREQVLLGKVKISPDRRRMVVELRYLTKSDTK